jgi:hypothetical protein
MVMYGPDDSHVIDSAGTFKLKRDAVAAYEAIKGAYKRLFRLEFERPLEPATKVEVLKEGKA